MPRVWNPSLARQLKELSFIVFSRKYLIFTNVSLSLIFYGVADMLAQCPQLVLGQLTQWDRKRTSEMAITGIPMGIFCHSYYTALDRMFPGNRAKMVMKKVLLDQIVCSPIGIFLFLTTTAIVHGSSMEEYVRELDQKAWRLYKVDAMVWPAAQVINFYFLPPRFRVLYDNTISLGCAIYRSYVRYGSPQNKNTES